jgi:hypothetical protein
MSNSGQAITTPGYPSISENGGQSSAPACRIPAQSTFNLEVEPIGDIDLIPVLRWP